MRINAFLLILAQIPCAPAAYADWSLVWRDGFSRIYLDPASLKKLDDGSILVKALTDYDPHSPEAIDFKLAEKGLSKIESARFDCAKNAYRSDGGSWFAGHMATGAARGDYPAKATWTKTPSFYRALAEKICAVP
ncbi:surface-adhesin E family protein [Methylocystis sp. JAN1]|uniref:surface-adhesin E family protein n=1 Tax=Methylocystis sp. JAN1 TaxID=3397211 RepID=UPI003FA33B9B